ncbi:hypothetical protein AHF37_12693 [Paragonimus kellicotti]|nr:hypothetical protein AHF37_12693 [Paragonimus kellicotti]
MTIRYGSSTGLLHFGPPIVFNSLHIDALKLRHQAHGSKSGDLLINMSSEPIQPSGEMLTSIGIRKSKWFYFHIYPVHSNVRANRLTLFAFVSILRTFYLLTFLSLS